MIWLELLILSYLLYVGLYTFLFSIAAFIRPAPPRSPLPIGTGASIHRIAVLIPAYREDAVIVESAQEALQQNYPASHMNVVVIADGLQAATLEALRALPVKLIEVQFEQSTKVKALLAGMDQLTEAYDIAVILDADNHMAADFLDQINRAWSAGHSAIQGRRVAKNRDSSLAILDGLSEMLNTHIYRAGSQALGLSAALMGSGMAFSYARLAQHLRQMDAVGGFDRDLEVRWLREGDKVYYLREAVVYDEKVSRHQDFARQRRRWIASQYQFLRRYAGLGLRALFAGKIALFNSALLRNIQLPRVLNLGLFTFVALLSLGLKPWLSLPIWIWWGLWAMMGLAMLVAVPLRFYDRAFFRALGTLPRTFWTMFLLLFKLKGANKEFLHTPHHPSK